MKIYLLADGVRTGQEVVLTATNNWTATFSELDVNKAGACPLSIPSRKIHRCYRSRLHNILYRFPDHGLYRCQYANPETITVEGAKHGMMLIIKKVSALPASPSASMPTVSKLERLLLLQKMSGNGFRRFK